MHNHRLPVLLTGFGPFPGMPVNASVRLVEALAPRARAAFPSCAIHAAILPAEWTAAPQRLEALITQVQPALMLLFGVAKDCTGFRIETQAHNACNAAEDAAGLLPASQWLTRDGPASHNATLPANEIVARLTARGLPAASSNDAGRYLCNAVLYHGLSYARDAKHPCRAGFIHIPHQIEGPPLTFDDALTGAIEILRVCLAGDGVNA